MTLLKEIKMTLKRHIKTNLWAGEMARPFRAKLFLKRTPVRVPEPLTAHNRL